MPRTSLRSLVLVLACLVLTGPLGVHAAQATPGIGGTPRATGPFDAMVDVDGRGLHVACAGTGSPTVVFEPGGPFIDGGTAVVAALGADLSAALGARFCSYDRAGSGQSAADPMGVRTFTESAADLTAILAIPELGCPCVVVGESLGGSIALVALAADPAGFAGLVLLDPPYPGFFDEFLALAPAGSAEAGLATDAYNTGANEERLDLITGFRQVTVPAEAPGIPSIVVAHGAGVPPPCNFDPPCSPDYPVAEFEAAWQAGQSALAEALGGRLVVADDTVHEIASENPALVVQLVSEVIAAVVDPTTWTTPEASPASSSA